MRKEREITINVISNNKFSYQRLADFFAKKYSDKYIDKQNKQCKKS